MTVSGRNKIAVVRITSRSNLDPPSPADFFFDFVVASPFPS
jgi:hypothetical protein